MRAWARRGRRAASILTTDPHWNSVVLLAVNAEIDVDASTWFRDIAPLSGRHLLTANGNAQWDTAAAPPGLTSSGLFDGSGDSISTPSHLDYSFGTNDFTIEAYARPDTITGTFRIVADWSSNVGWSFGFLDSDQMILTAQGTNINSSVTTIPTTEFRHYAVTRQGTSVKFWNNGVLVSTHTNSDNILPTVPLHIGRNDSATFPQYFDGWIAGVRVTRGVARYTSNFTPPTLPMEANGNDPYWSNVVLLALNNNGADGSTTFTDQTNGVLPTVVGNAQRDTSQAPTGLTSSAQFDGTGDRLQFTNTEYQLPAAFTIEAFVRVSSVAAYQAVAVIGNEAFNRVSIYVGPTLLIERFGVGALVSGGTPVINTWHYIAWTRNASNLHTIYLDGVSVGTPATNSGTYGNSDNIHVGAISNNNNCVNGHVAAVRVTKGVARTIGVVPSLPFQVS